MRLMEFATVMLTSHYIFQNLEVAIGGKGVEVSGESTIVRNNFIHDTYTGGVFLWKTKACEVANNNLTRNGSTQIYLQSGSHNWVHHNTVSNTGLDQGNTGTIIAGNCFIPNTENCSVGLQQGTDNLIEYNSLSYSRGDFFDWWLEVDTEVRYNYGFHSGMATAPHGTGLKVHHNIFNMDLAGNGINAYHEYDSKNSPKPDTGPVLVYNNVIYNFKSSGLYTAGGNLTQGVVFRNNIVVTTSPMFVLAGLSGGVVSDYNIFFRTTGTWPAWNWNGVNYSSLSAYQQASGQDKHSIYANPLFFSEKPGSAADFKVGANSPAFNNGQDLKAAGIVGPTQFNMDFIGTTIPQGAAPDIGPFEYLVPPSEPSDLKLTIR